MSDEGQDVAKSVVSATLPCCFPPVFINVQDSSGQESQSRTPGNSGVSTVYTNSNVVSAVFANSSAVEDSFSSLHNDKSCPEICSAGAAATFTDNVADVDNATCAPDPNSDSLTFPKPENSEFKDIVNPFVYVNAIQGLPLPSPHLRPLSAHLLSEQKESDDNQCIESLNNNDRNNVITSDENSQKKETEYLYSGSTDETLQNSDASTESEYSVVNLTQKFTQVIDKGNKNMGNKQPRTSQVHSDDDTPDDGRTKCCEIPKKKVKERNNRGNRTSRNDDLNFEANEVYPFDGRAGSEQDINEPVELEPFEIVETDDIKFVPGAGTSDVIKSVSEPKFTPIAEEPPLCEDEPSKPPSHNDENTNVKVPFFIDKGNRLIEPGTATAHSTFEFRQVKPKMKVSILPSEQPQRKYENVSLEENRSESNVSGRKTSSSSSKSSSSSSSKSVSRNNSKDAIPKPTRKGKSKASGESIKVGDESDKRKRSEKSQRQQSVRDSEIDRNIDNVLMLTQTMFSQTKVAETQDKKQSKTQPETVPLTQYENVNVCAKMESTGITITHKNTHLDTKTSEKTECTPSTSKEPECVAHDCEGKEKDVQEKQNKRKKMSQLSTDIVEISETGTLIIKSLADMPSAAKSEQSTDNSFENTHEDNLDENTDIKVPYETIDRLSTEIKKETLGIDGSSKIEEKEITDEKEHVPPPSPLIMGVLEEEEEEDLEDDEDITDFNDENRRKSEILEFTENVCKRLSQLLESAPDEETVEDENETDQNEEHTIKTYEDHIYETIDGSTKVSDQNTKSISVLKVFDANGVEGIDQSSETVPDKLKLSTRSESSSTLKRKSGDSETYKSVDTRKSSQSDDDLPDYFDPREIPPPKRESEILCDVLETYQDDALEMDELPAKEVVEMVEKHTFVFGGLNYDNLVLENKDKISSSSVKSFETGLINNAPDPSTIEDLKDITPTAEAQPNLTALTELAKAEEDLPVQFETSGRQSVTCTESDIDISEHRDDLSTDSMLADDEAEETMEILFTKTYTEPVEGAEVFLSCTVVNSAYKDEQKKSETWLSDEALEYLEANASEVMSTAFLKAKKEMKDIQICLQSLRQQMEHFHSDCDDISLPEIPVDSLSPDYFGMPMRKAVTD